MTGGSSNRSAQDSLGQALGAESIRPAGTTSTSQFQSRELGRRRANRLYWRERRKPSASDDSKAALTHALAMPTTGCEYEAILAAVLIASSRSSAAGTMPAQRHVPHVCKCMCMCRVHVRMRRARLAAGPRARASRAKVSEGLLMTRRATADKASGQGLFNRHEVARQDELHGARLAQRTREALRATQARDGAQLDLWLPALSKEARERHRHARLQTPAGASTDLRGTDGRQAVAAHGKRVPTVLHREALPNLAVSAARMKSHAIASSQPPPSAKPLTAAMTGFFTLDRSSSSEKSCPFILPNERTRARVTCQLGSHC